MYMTLWVFCPYIKRFLPKLSTTWSHLLIYAIMKSFFLLNDDARIAQRVEKLFDEQFTFWYSFSWVDIFLNFLWNNRLPSESRIWWLFCKIVFSLNKQKSYTMPLRYFGEFSKNSFHTFLSKLPEYRLLGLKWNM